MKKGKVHQINCPDNSLSKMNLKGGGDTIHPNSLSKMGKISTSGGTRPEGYSERL